MSGLDFLDGVSGRHDKGEMTCFGVVAWGVNERKTHLSGGKGIVSICARKAGN